MDGVSCTLCHQIRDDGLGTKGSFTGKYHIDTDKTGSERELFGPYNGVWQSIEFGVNLFDTDSDTDPDYGTNWGHVITPLVNGYENSVQKKSEEKP